METEEAWRVVPGAEQLALHVCTFLATTGLVAITTWAICSRMTSTSSGRRVDACSLKLTRRSCAVGLSMHPLETTRETTPAELRYVVAGSLMLTNLSTEQLVGLNGTVYTDHSMAGIWLEAGAALAMTITATLFLPRYMALGLTTTSGFLGERFDLFTRTLGSLLFLVFYVFVVCPFALYTGALAIRNIFDLDSIGLLIVGIWVPAAALYQLGGVSTLFEEPKVLKSLVEHSVIAPWHVNFTGLFLTNVYYWSTNQARDVGVPLGQPKVVGFIFLCLPGTIGLLLVRRNATINGEPFTETWRRVGGLVFRQVKKSDEVYPELVKAVMPLWSLGFFAAVLVGSVLSSFNSALNSAATIFGLEIYKDASERRVVNVSTVFGAAMTLGSFVVAPLFQKIDVILSFQQHVNTIISLPLVVIFLVGIGTSLPDAFAAKCGFAVGVCAVVAGQFEETLHYFHTFFIAFVLATLTILVTTYVPCIRRLCGQAPKPVAHVQRLGAAKVEMRPWRPVHPLVCGLLAVLAVLIISLQLGSEPGRKKDFVVEIPADNPVVADDHVVGAGYIQGVNECPGPTRLTSPRAGTLRAEALRVSLWCCSSQQRDRGRQNWEQHGRSGARCFDSEGAEVKEGKEVQEHLLLRRRGADRDEGLGRTPCGRIRQKQEKILELMSLPTAWDCGRKDRLDWKCLVKLSRPGWWLVHVWLYLAPTGQKYHLLSSLPLGFAHWRLERGIYFQKSFWLGLAYVLFPLNLLVYGLNDYTDVELDAKNARKGNFMYGAKCSAEQLKDPKPDRPVGRQSSRVQDLPRMIVILNVVPIIILALVSGQWLALSIWLPTCFAVNLAYNVEPLRLSSKGPFELPCVVFGFAGVTALASIVNNLGWAPIGYWAHMSCLVLRTQIWTGTEFLDYDPDAACGRRTTSTLLGKDLSKALVVILLALEGLVTWYFFEDHRSSAFQAWLPLSLWKSSAALTTRQLTTFIQTFDEVPKDYQAVVQELQERHVEVHLRTSESMLAKPLPLTKNDLVVGDFDWTRIALRQLGCPMPPPPDYPKCLQHLLYRKILREELKAMPDRQVFIKPAVETKAFSAIDLIAEYRVYVVHGEVRAICHYKGPASPPLDEQVVHEAVRTLWKNYTDLLIARWQRLTTGVFPATRAEKLQETLKDVEIKKESLATIFSGVDAVIACPGSRQSGIATTCTIGARKIVAAMKKAKVERLVVLSSFGIGDDYMPSSVLKFFWGFLLRVVWPTMRRDVEGMEKISGLEYLIVRPMGVDPKELPVGSYAILTARGQGSLPLTVAKDDVGLFLLEEAVAPKHTKTGVTIGDALRCLRAARRVRPQLRPGAAMEVIEAEVLRGLHAFSGSELCDALQSFGLRDTSNGRDWCSQLLAADCITNFSSQVRRARPELLQLLEPQVLETGTKPSEFLQKKETAADADTVASGKHRNAELRSAPNTPVSEDDQNTQEVFWQAALSSALLSSRLAQGAKVKELERTEGGRLRYELIAGDGPKTGWVSLSAKGHDLLRRIGQKTSEPMLNTDYSGVVRGACTNCRDCQLWRFESFSSVEWGGSDTSSTIEETSRAVRTRAVRTRAVCSGAGTDPQILGEVSSKVNYVQSGFHIESSLRSTCQDRRQAYDRKMRGYRETRKGQGALCEACQCKAEHHLDLSGWLEAVRQAARPFRQTYEDAIRKDPAYRHLGMAMGTAKPRRLPRHAELPAAALQWPHSEVAMFLLSLGVYDPRYHARDGGGPGGDTVSSVSPPGPGSLISVICPTSQKRHAFHPLLYQNFCSQTYEEKELLVLETGSRPSEFLQKKAKEDSRVVYWHFPVEDSRENDPMSAVILDDGFSVYTGEEVKKRSAGVDGAAGLHFKPKAGWSLGFKRNLCCHLARGTVIAHFDDDDLYAPRYLEEMREALLIAERSSAAAARPAAATLAEWHMMDVKDQRFGFFSPRNEPLLEHEQRESFLYGYGFSFVYTKSAWERVPFPDTEQKVELVPNQTTK
eukprot:g33632.t1